MAKQDRVFIRTPAALEQKYDFGRSFRETEGRLQAVGRQAQQAQDTARQAENTAAAARSEVLQLSDSISLSVENGETTAQIKLKVGDREIPATIDMKGMVTFTNLENSGATKIDGGNIVTGKIMSRDGESVVIDLDKGTAKLVGSVKTETESDSDGDYSSSMMPRHVTAVNLTNSRGSYLSWEEVSVWSETITSRLGRDKWEIRPEPASEDYPNYHLMGQVDTANGLVQLYLLSKNGTHPLQIVSVGGSNYVRGLSEPEQDRDAATKAYVDKALTEDSDCPGCFYRWVDGRKEWLNPPMVLGEEYCTTERWQGLPVYRKYQYLGTTTAGSVTLDHGIADFSGCLEIQLTDGFRQNITHHSNIQSLYVTEEGVHITAGMAQTIYATIKYTKA